MEWYDFSQQDFSINSNCSALKALSLSGTPLCHFGYQKCIGTSCIYYNNKMMVSNDWIAGAVCAADLSKNHLGRLLVHVDTLFV